MGGLRQWFGEKWQEFCNRRAYGRSIQPEFMERQALELAELAEQASRGAAPLHEDERRQLAELARHMRQLIDTTHKPEFCRLPAERRWTLHSQMNAARTRLIASLQKTQVPTEKPQ